MKKIKLEIEYSYDFELIGLMSSAKGYKLAWEMNQQLRFNLIKSTTDLKIHHKNKSSTTYTYYTYQNALNKLKLFRNKPNETGLSKLVLVPEFPHFDFILMCEGEEHMQGKRLQEDLRKIATIELLAFIPLDDLKNKDHFIF